MTAAQMLHDRTKRALAQLLVEAESKGQKARARRLQTRLDEVLAFERAHPTIAL